MGWWHHLRLRALGVALVFCARHGGPEARDLFVRQIDARVSNGLDSHTDPVAADGWFKMMQIHRDRLLGIRYGD
jgi:hypothetical protein